MIARTRVVTGICICCTIYGSDTLNVTAEMIPNMSRQEELERVQN